jgi:uncharacterized protein (DUF58 family)
MWFKTIFRRKNDENEARNKSIFDEHFLRRLERMSLQTQRSLRGHPSGVHRSMQRLSSTIFSDHRPYTSGDDLRYIDWNAYARHNSMVVKLGEAEQDVDVHLLLDTSRSMEWGSPTKFHVMQQLAGTLGYLSLTHGDRVLVVPFGERPVRPFGPTQGKGRLVEMLRYIEEMVVQPHTNIGEVFQRHAKHFRRGGVLVLCSDLLTAEGLDAGLHALPPPKWQVLVLHIIDLREIEPKTEPSTSGPIELRDSETGQRLALTLDEPTLSAYRKHMFEWQEELASICAKRGARYARIMTDWPLEKKIIPYLRSRQILQ